MNGVPGNQQRRNDDADEAATTSVSDEAADSLTISLDETFDVLKNPRRRFLIQYLDEGSDAVPVGDLARQIAAWENDKPPDAVTSTERKRVYVALYQVHLPKLDELDVVEYEQSRGIVCLGPNAAALRPYLSFDEADAQRPWPRYFVALSAGTAGLLGGAVVLEPMTTLPVVLIAIGLSLGAFWVTTLPFVRD